eukprot:Lankesteria_metandrocarpae@DN8134_c0_g1_i1.p1
MYSVPHNARTSAAAISSTPSQQQYFNIQGLLATHTAHGLCAAMNNTATGTGVVPQQHLGHNRLPQQYPSSTGAVQQHRQQRYATGVASHTPTYTTTGATTTTATTATGGVSVTKSSSHVVGAGGTAGVQRQRPTKNDAVVRDGARTT